MSAFILNTKSPGATDRPDAVSFDSWVLALRVLELKPPNKLPCHMFTVLEVHSDPGNK